ncbi:hypothetical protein DKX38_003403 [Salix brachista]|uniref:Uncharacterized protein n=1 Tax=Salix brachista TaxID=2182728 RepID=A0A5N5NPS0_9ROSI|nr:hypothetical protein DKX38_003403 [Salix brachista]
MALQAGVSTSKVLILVGAEILKGVDQVELAPYKYDSALLAAQIRQLAQEIKELTLSSPATIYNRNYASNGREFFILPSASSRPWSNGILLHVVEGKILNA